MEDTGLILTPMLVRCLLGPLGLSGPMTSTSGLINLLEGIACLWLPTHPQHPPHPLPPTHHFICAIHDIIYKFLKIHQYQLATIVIL